MEPSASHRVPVILIDRAGDRRDVEVCLQPASDHHPFPETLVDRMSATGAPFLICAADGQIELIHRRAISHLETEAQLPELSQPPELGVPTTVEISLLLDNGARLSGELCFQKSHETPRLSVFLNSASAELLLLRLDGRVALVPRHAVASIRIGPDD